MNKQQEFNYAIDLLKNGFSSLKIAKTEADSFFDEILIKQHLANFPTLILKLNMDPVSTIKSQLDDFQTDLPQNLVLFFDIIKQYKAFLRHLITGSSKKRSKLFNFITKLKINLNLSLYLKIRFFQNKLKNLSKNIETDDLNLSLLKLETK